MKVNATATDVITQNARYPIAGTTQIGSIIQRFTHDSANNAVQYVSSVTRTFRVLMTFSLTSTQNNIIGVYIGVNRDGDAIDADADRVSESEINITAAGSRPDTGSVQCLTTLNENDKVYGIVQNTSSNGDITVIFLNLIIEATSN